MRQGVVLRFVGEIPEHVLHIAGEDAAQVVQGGGGDVPVVFQGIQRSPAEGVLFNKRVGSYALALHGLPERVVYDNGVHLPVTPLYFLVIGLNIPDVLSIIWAATKKIERS